MILPEVRDPRLITIRRGGTLTDADHRLLALWAAACAEHVLPLFERAVRDDARPREAIEAARSCGMSGFLLVRLFRRSSAPAWDT